MRLTYHRGESEAQEIVDEIRSQGGSAGCFQYDVLAPSLGDSDLSVSTGAPSHLYYFATPFIFSGSKGRFSPESFRQFCDYYVIGLSQALDLLQGCQVSKVFYPSSVAIDELPANMGEYAITKSASELLSDFLQKCYPGTSIYGTVDDKEESPGFLLETFERFATRATFFVECANYFFVGDEPM